MEHKPNEALAEYKVALTLSPNRLNGLLSAGKAAEEAGLKDEAKSYYKAAAAQTSNAGHSKRPELEYAVKVAGRRSSRRVSEAFGRRRWSLTYCGRELSFGISQPPPSEPYLIRTTDLPTSPIRLRLTQPA